MLNVKILSILFFIAFNINQSHSYEFNENQFNGVGIEECR